MNMYSISIKELLHTTGTTLDCDNKFITYEKDTLVFKELNFNDVLFFELYENKLLIKYALLTEDQKEFRKTIEKVTCENGQNVEIKNILKIKFQECSFLNMMIDSKSNTEEVSFSQCDFNGEFSIQDKKLTKLCIELSTFEKYVQFQRSEFKELIIETSTFKNIVNFQDCSFETTSFENVSFKENIYFSRLKVGDNCNIDFTNIFFKENANFYGIRQKNKTFLEAKNINNRETARIIKNSFEKQNNIIESNKFYALEMQKREEELNWQKNFSEWLIFKAHKLGSNHSQDWILSILLIINISIFYTYYNLFSFYREYYFVPFLIVFVNILVIMLSKDNINRLFFTLVSYSLYVFIGHDFSLYCVVKNLNFLFLKSNIQLNISLLIYRITIGYLIYQFIISIRQNTRRK